MSKKITIVTKDDNTKFETDTQLIQRSFFLKQLLEQFPDNDTVEIPNLKGPILALIMEWLEKHRNEKPKNPPQPLRNYDLVEILGKWEDDYMTKVHNKSFNSLFEFLNAVNYLDIPELLELASAKTACLIKDFTPDEFKKLFKIEEDCTSEDLKKIEEEVLKEREEEREKERIRLEEEEKLKAKKE